MAIHISRKKREWIVGYLLVLPSLAIVLTFIFYPLAQSFWLSVAKMDLATGATTYVGAKYYIQVFNNKDFYESLLKTAYFGVFAILGATFLAICISLILNEKFVGDFFMKGIIMLPWAVPPVVSGLLWKWIFHGNHGAFNGLLYATGIIPTYIEWVARLPSPIIAFVVIWRNVSFATIILLASLQVIPQEQYEAALIDGANAWQRFRKITLVHIKPALLITLILNTVWSLRIFDEVFVMTKGGPAGATTYLSWMTYLQAFSFNNFGIGNTLAYLLAIISLILAVSYIRIIRVSG